MFPDYKYLVGFKSRDFVSGNIEKLQILGNVTKGANVVIIDDLCSGGRTFSMSAEKLKEIGCGDIYLIVGHCENTIFEYGFLENKNIKHVFTTNSILKTQTHPKLSVLDVL
jgi:ribose-phosphate pyrophosphokinase